jgi:hypothetical protein
MAKSFQDWTQYDLEQAFGLVKKRTNECNILKDWLAVPNTINEPNEEAELDVLAADLAEYADVWNEEELKAFFIIPFLRLVNFKSDKYKVFFERKLTTQRNGITLTGVVDAMIASGSYSRIAAPFFCLQEYKPEKRKSANDVRGQLLAEMLTAQTLNDTDSPIYGCYLNGRLWFFATLIGSHYCFSNGFVADNKDDMTHIFNALRKLRGIIDEKIK